MAHGLTIHSSRRRFAARLNSGVRHMKLLPLSAALFAIPLIACGQPPVATGIIPKNCFIAHLDPGGEVELTAALDRIASTNQLKADRSSSSYVGYTRHDGSYAALLKWGPKSQAIVTSYGKSAPDLSTVPAGAKYFKWTPCPPTSRNFSPPTLYGH